MIIPTPPNPERRAELLLAAAAWRRVDSIGMTEGLRASCEAAARALEMEAEDGIARCCCCFKPFGAPMALFRR